MYDASLDKTYKHIKPAYQITVRGRDAIMGLPWIIRKVE
jgi:hypothetical protein